MGGTCMAGKGNGINSLKILVDDRERKKTLGRYLSGWKNNYKFHLQLAGEQNVGWILLTREGAVMSPWE